MKVLIVEDNDGIALVIKSFLEPISSQITIAKNMEKALQVLSEASELEMITLDLGLPDSDVVHTIEKIKEIRKRKPDSLLIVVTGNEYPELEKIVKEQGADGLFYKSAENFTSTGFLSFIGSIAKHHLSSPQNYQHSLGILEKVVTRVSEIENKCHGSC